MNSAAPQTNAALGRYKLAVQVLEAITRLPRLQQTLRLLMDAAKVVGESAADAPGLVAELERQRLIGEHFEIDAVTRAEAAEGCEAALLAEVERLTADLQREHDAADSMPMVQAERMRTKRDANRAALDAVLALPDHGEPEPALGGLPYPHGDMWDDGYRQAIETVRAAITDALGSATLKTDDGAVSPETSTEARAGAAPSSPDRCVLCEAARAVPSVFCLRHGGTA